MRIPELFKIVHSAMGRGGKTQTGSIADNTWDSRALGDEMYELVRRLYPICRSITGQGVRDTLSVIAEYLPVVQHEIASGTKVYDWQVPNEWNISDAYVSDANGRRIIDFKESNLHVVSYSMPVDAELSLEELTPHIHTLPDEPDRIPYRTSYYNEDWGFCMRHRDFVNMRAGNYRVCIASSLKHGALTYGEYFKPGGSKDEILFFAHCCHPSLCNDNLSGIAVLTFLGALIANLEFNHSVRIVFAPATIGSITWLSEHREALKAIRGGLVASVLGDSGGFNYKRTRIGNSRIDHVCEHVLEHFDAPTEIRPFSPWGYDERQFCSPGFNLPVGRLTRTPNGEYAEYHTSADDLDLVSKEALLQSLELYLEVLLAFDFDRTYLNTAPYGEPQLGRRGLYSKLGGFREVERANLAMLWMLNLSDGKNSLIDIAQRSGMHFSELLIAARILEDSGLLKRLHQDVADDQRQVQ